ncbi:MAG: acetylxylan esterase, partial [Acidobacteriia bacterium]|nr:acetylxylan esterase [Terriglobia bacterium]
MTPILCLAALQVVGGLTGMLDAWLTRIAERQWTARTAQVAAIHTPEDVARRQRYIREKMLASLGGLPEKTPLHAVITGHLERDGYRVEKLIYESLPGFKVTANVYVPLNGTAPFPAVIGVAGHSITGKAEPAYQSAWISMARRGFLVLAIDPPGQGERSEYWDAAAGKSRVGIGTREHTMAGLQCLLTGTNIARYQVWDGIRGFDYLLTRKDVDGKRIAVAGNSGGGTQSAYLAVAEPRLAAAAPSCYITSWEKLWFAPGPQDAEQNLHGFLRDGLNFGDFLIAFAPKPIQMMTATRDFFPIDGARATYEETARVFQAAGVKDHVAMFEYDDGHGWSKPRREATYRFLEKWFHQRLEEGLEGALTIEPAENLQATATGQLSTSGGSETVSSLNSKLAEQMHAKREATRRGAVMSQLIADTLVVSIERTVKATPAGQVQREAYRIERIALETEEAITVPSLLLLPNGVAGPLPAVVYLNCAGKAADAGPGGDIE